MPYKLIVTESYFKKAKRFFKKHPEVLDRYEKAMVLLQHNPHHPSLRLHKLQGKLCDYYGISFTMKYRVVIDFVIGDEMITPIDIGTHDEVY